MIRIICVLLMCVLSNSVFGVIVSERLLDAIAMVESNNNPCKVGKLGEVGVFQIRQYVVDDVNRKYKTSYTIEDAKTSKGREICKKYLQYWGNWYEVKTGRSANNQILAKIWNGGPKAPMKNNRTTVAMLRRYWKKVQSHII